MAFQQHVAPLRASKQTIGDVIHRLLEVSATLTGSSELHALLLTGCPRTPQLDAQLRRFEDGVTSQIEALLVDARVESGNVSLLARLLFVASDSALHQVILPMRRAKDRSAAIDELASLLTVGIKTKRR
jgi:uncharacterized membrane-anchored protein